ncbi:TraY domain-containing protein [Sodalis glossinidius]|uniref:TraY domain-containing protein n=1 Tax=Sodalis glossinidius TaxID=63612 RepID=UPI000054C959|nr:TraY domain-containing protein [Sodalis glossinidius]CAI59287.1 TraY protein [Sodalis glossinidius]CAI59460.1 TraY protein [Sodalis glossinidius]
MRHQRRDDNPNKLITFKLNQEYTALLYASIQKTGKSRSGEVKLWVQDHLKRFPDFNPDSREVMKSQITSESLSL